ncbi:MAG: hypothetical protein U9R15_11795 [Chloroflexota bacterium]|nr:hypothetical protein [Chloroflexota bacterium]
MTKKTLILLGIAILLAGLLAGCGGAAEEAAPVAADAALKISGNVEAETGWAEADVKAMDTIDVESTNKDGETSTYTGVPLNTLLGLAGVKDGATTLVFVADDGYTVEVVLADVQTCDNCIVAFRDQGGFITIMPEFPGNTQVKGIVEIQVQ